MSFRAFALAILLASTPVLAQRTPTVAMVTDLAGGVTLVGAKGGAKAGLAAELPADAKIEVAAGGRVVVLVLSTGDQYTLSGPVSARVMADGLAGDPASRLEKRASSVGKVRLKSDGLAQAAVTLRAAKRPETLPLAGLAGTVTLETSPTFRWTAVEGAGPYRFELQDSGGAVLHETRTDATALTLPGAVSLVEGRSYTWEVSTRKSNGIGYSNFGDFTVAPAALRAEAARLRPPAGAPVADRVAYAAWLTSQELNDEARSVWSALSAENPDDPRLKALSAR